MKTLRNFSIVGIIPFWLLGTAIFSGSGDEAGLTTVLLIAYLLVTFLADIWLSWRQLHLNDKQPEPMKTFIKRFALYAAEVIGIGIAIGAAYRLLPAGVIDPLAFGILYFIFLALIAAAAVVMLIAGIIRTKKAAETSGKTPSASDKTEKLRNFGVFGLLAAAGAGMLLTEQWFLSEFNLVMYIIGVVLSVVLTFTADYLLSVWQLHLQKGMHEGFADYSKRVMIYLAEKAAVLFITLKVNGMLTAYPMENRTFSLGWLCFASAMTVTTVIVLLKGAVQNSGKAVRTAA